jgi:membrane protein implicated in regulation of membrane protease activity
MDDFMLAVLAFVVEFILAALYLALVMVVAVVVGVAKLIWKGLRLAYGLVVMRRSLGRELRRIQREEASALREVLRIGAEAQAQLRRLGGRG